ncbi:hypothetical protein M0R72_17840 [Candidatus Pacearchaeota archaeon]|jgi:hypothetical protein|nr:hypothetical protein [Candidatus Pacearchaeota archaeon]
MRLDPLYLWLAVLAIGFSIVSLVLLLPTGHAMTLQITGSSTGQGVHNLTFWGEHLNATLFQGNNSTWVINATGANGV